MDTGGKMKPIDLSISISEMEQFEQIAVSVDVFDCPAQFILNQEDWQRALLAYAFAAPSDATYDPHVTFVLDCYFSQILREKYTITDIEFIH